MKTLIFLIGLIVSPLVHAELVVVVAENSPIDKVNEQRVSNIFLSKTNRYPNGDKAIPLEYRDSSLRSDFYKHISNKTPTQLRSYWTTLIFTGKGIPPKSFSNKTEMMTYLINNPGTVTYLPRSDVAPGMKIIYRLNME